jgi:hypothetical protein
MDPSSDVADRMVAHKNATEMCLVSQKLEQDTISAPLSATPSPPKKNRKHKTKPFEQTLSHMKLEPEYQ